MEFSSGSAHRPAAKLKVCARPSEAKLTEQQAREFQEMVERWRRLSSCVLEELDEAARCSASPQE
jgi:hypothetical protein